MPSHDPVRSIAFYLPQFHPIPENDAWWGKGFTEWTNVVRTMPRFPGHEQPHLPSELGYYDLRCAESREAQAELARAHGISGFCYYHYWFGGRRVLERPFEEVVASGRPDFPFALCWANESWSRRWDGLDAEVLLEQTYGDEDDRRHLEALAPALRDPRYIRVGDRPLLLIYRAARLPDARRTIETWRRTARRIGVGDLYLCNVESFPQDDAPMSDAGFDAAVEFAPDWSCLPPAAPAGPLEKLGASLGVVDRASVTNRPREYAQLVENMLAKPRPAYLRYPCVTPSWDNSARRREGATILRGATPEAYEAWLSEVLTRFEPRSPDENLFFVNAWNEWAEGNHLEPCRRWGRGYLEATRRALETRHRAPAAGRTAVRAT